MCGVAATAQGVEWDEAVTLDPDACAEVWQQVQRGGERPVSGVPFMPTQETAESKRWQAVRQATGTPLMPVLLLAWLQELNPLTPMAEQPTRYADVLGICEQAFAGNRAAAQQLAAALRVGVFENGLLMYRSAAAAQEVEASATGALEE